MKIQLVGTCHNDPMGKVNLKQCFQQSTFSNGCMPTFVAVEYSEQQFIQIRSQRPQFRELICEAWPQAGRTFINALADSLAYEADTHTELWPDMETLWLQEGDNRDVSAFAKQRLLVYKGYLNSPPQPWEDQRGIETLRENVWAVATSAEQELTEKDARWAELVKQKVSQCDDKWAVAVIGAAHTKNSPGWFRNILETNGFKCEVTESLWKWCQA